MTNLSLTKLKPFAKISLAVISLIVGVILITIIFASVTQKKSPEKASSSPPTLSPKKVSQPSKFQDQLSIIKALLPYKGENYSIEYLQPVNIINVKITANSRDQFVKTKKIAEDFIKSKGIKDICSLNIFWVPPSNLPAKTIQPTELITSGCPVIPK